jgi:hypothetical protein
LDGLPRGEAINTIGTGARGAARFWRATPAELDLQSRRDKNGSSDE